MIDPIVGQVALGIYAALLAAGGVFGFLKAGSNASLIAGVGSGAVAVIALVLSVRTASGYGLGAGLATLMLIFFWRRFIATRKFMPNGMLAGLSLVVLGLMIMNLVMYPTR